MLAAMNDAFELTHALVGDRLCVVSMQTCPRRTRELCGLGVHPGSELEVVHCRQGGRCVVAHGTDRIALGHAMSSKIIVKRVA